MYLSVIIPCFNEQEVLPLLFEKLEIIFANLLHDEEIDEYEIIFVDDGSSDSTWTHIHTFHKKNPRIKGLRFLRNFGHHVALSAGIDHAMGDAIIFLDADLQEPPEAIPTLLRKYKEGYDTVYCVRKSRKDSMLKKVGSNIFWNMLNVLSGLHMPVNQFTLRILDRHVCEALRHMRETSRFMAGMIAWIGGRSIAIEAEHHKRVHGKTKYSFYKLVKLAVTAVASFSTVPLRMAVTFGCIFALFSFMGGIFVVYRKVVYGIPILGWASIMVAIFLVGGVQLLILGILGQYLGMTYREVQQRPLYLIRDRLT